MYPKEIKGYYFYHLEEKRLLASLRTTFLENRFLTEEMKASKIELGKVQLVEEPIHSKDITESAMSESHPEPTLRRSDRVPRQSNIYYSFLVRDSDPIELDENNEDPITYMDAL